MSIGEGRTRRDEIPAQAPHRRAGLAERRVHDGVGPLARTGFLRVSRSWWQRVNFSLPLAFGALVFAVALFANGYRRTLAPDIHVDELIYTSVGQNLASGHGLSVQGQPFFWQPPLMFILEWPIANAFGLAGDGTFDATLQLRLLNDVVGALTAVAIFALGWRLRGAWAAWAMSLLFVTDPFVIRVTRRLYIEPFAALWILAALWVCYVSLGRWTWKRRVAVGVLFGLAVLSKELAAFALAVLVLLWLRREMSWKEPLLITTVAATTYMLYALWAVAEGNVSYFLALKRFQVNHLLGVFHLNGFNRPGASFVQALADNAGDYWTSYLCIALAVPATAWLWFRGDRTGRFLAAWSAVSFGFVAAMAKFGSLEDQSFYFLMLPVLCVLGYVYSFSLPRLVRDLRIAWRSSSPRRVAPTGIAVLIALVVGLAVLGPNLRVWAIRFGTGEDHGYTDLLASINQNVPRGAVIDSPGGSSEELKFAYPDGRYQLIRVVDPAQLRIQHIHWYVLRSKDVVLANGIDQRYYDYITAHATRVWFVSEHTFLDFGLWYVADPSKLPDVSFPLPAKPAVPLPQPTPQ